MNSKPRMRRLRGLAVQVLDENATGEDVTDQYVDLQSQLVNLEATRARIQEFLQDAKSVDEALRVNQELANIEAQIEQIKGRMNYLTDRSAYSTITINLEPEFPVLTPTPTSTPHPDRDTDPVEACGHVQRSQRHSDGRVSGNRQFPDLAGCGHPAHPPAACLDPVGDVEVVDPQAKRQCVIRKW